MKKKRSKLLLGGIILVIILIIAVLFAIFFISPIFSKTNIQETVELKGCRIIPGVIGPEDFEYLAKENILVVSSLDRRTSQDTQGKLYWIDLSIPHEDQTAKPILINYPDYFRPHGISFQQTDEGGKLFVISHPLKGKHRHTIEVFSLNSSAGSHQWNHVKTLKHELIISPNDLAALADGTLFITNDFQDIGGFFTHLIDILFGRKRAPIVYYGGNEFIYLGTRVTSSPGIAYMKEGDQEYLFQSDFINRSVKKIKIHRDQKGFPTLEPVSDIFINTGPDNLLVDENNNIYVAGHHSIGLFLDHVKDKKALSPTQIIKILPNGEYITLYANKGEAFSAGSVALVIKDRLYIGQVFNDGVLSCSFRD